MAEHRQVDDGGGVAPTRGVLRPYGLDKSWSGGRFVDYISRDENGGARSVRLAHGRVHSADGFVVVETYAQRESRPVPGGTLTVGPRLADAALLALSRLVEFAVEPEAWEDWTDRGRDEVEGRQRRRWHAGDEPGDDWCPISLDVSGAQVPGWTIEREGGWAVAAELPDCLLGLFGRRVPLDRVQLAAVDPYSLAWPDGPDYESSVD